MQNHNLAIAALARPESTISYTSSSHIEITIYLCLILAQSKSTIYLYVILAQRGSTNYGLESYGLPLRESDERGVRYLSPNTPGINVHYRCDAIRLLQASGASCIYAPV